MNPDSVLSLLQTNFLLNIKTGNTIIDTIITIFILLYAKKLFELIIVLLKYLRKLILKKNNILSEYLIQGTISISTEYCNIMTSFPQEYQAIMYKIHDLKVNIKYAKQLNNSLRLCDTEKTNMPFSYSVNTNEEIRISNDIYIRQTIDTEKSNDLKASIQFYNLYVYSYNINFIELKKIISNWTKEYEKYIKENTDGNIYYFSYLGKNKICGKKDDSAVTNLEFESHKFYSNKSFDNIFFESKKDLKNRLDYFLNNEIEYKNLGIPYTLGLLFYGSPGCGKTSTIKAISNYTKRHILEIPLSKIKTCRELKKIFFDEIINNQYIPSNKKIIVLEDIDCMNDIVKKRSNVIEKVNKRNIKNKDIFYQRMLKNIDDKDDYMDDNLTLSYILNLIDGVLEQPGRILIITSNFPDNIDDALIRPGRIDMEIDFKKCTNKVIKDILGFYFKEKIDDNINFPDYKYTPADIFQKCFNINNLDEIIHFLE